jgi:hypothetical protein
MDKDARNCMPDVSFFTYSLGKRPNHMTESHVRERCFGAQGMQGEANKKYYIQLKDTTPLAQKGNYFFRGHFGYTIEMPPENIRHYQVLVKL